MTTVDTGGKDPKVKYSEVGGRVEAGGQKFKEARSHNGIPIRCFFWTGTPRVQPHNPERLNLGIYDYPFSFFLIFTREEMELSGDTGRGWRRKFSSIMSMN